MTSQQGKPLRTFGDLDPSALFERGDVYRVAYDPVRASLPVVRLAILGAGGVAQARHLPAIHQLQSWWEPVQVVGMSIRDEPPRSHLAEAWRIPAFASVEQLLQETSPDAVIVTSSDAAHAEQTLAALEAGCHVLVEKPIATSLVDAERMSRLSETKGRIFGTVANKRYSPPYVEAKRLIDSGSLETPRLLAGKFTLGYDYLDLLDDATIHLLDLARFFMGDVSQILAASPQMNYEDSLNVVRAHDVAITLRYKSGALGTLLTSANATSLHPWERIEIYGRHSWIEVNDQRSVSFYPSEYEPARTWEHIMPSTLFTAAEWGGFVGLIKDFLDAVRGSTMKGTDTWDGYRAYELATAARLSLLRGESVNLPLDAAGADSEVGPYRST